MLAHLLSKFPPFCIAGGSCHAILQEPQLAQLFIKALPPLAQHRIDQGGSHKHGCRATSIAKAVAWWRHQISKKHKYSTRVFLQLLLLLLVLISLISPGPSLLMHGPTLLLLLLPRRAKP
jgi:hypothetical protein